MKPLQGVKVVEFATHVAVPAAGRLMADWGAEVIKIESFTGDPWRNHGGFVKLPTLPDCNPAFAVDNSGKKFVSLNLKQPEGKAALMKILEDTDIFITNIRWGGIERLGLDYDTLHERFPELIYFHFNGFGYDGPDKDLPGFDHSGFWAMSGAIHEMRDADGRPAIPPSGFGDTATSGFVLSGILAALYQRTRTGEGMRLTTSLYASGIWCNFSRIAGSQDRCDGSEPDRYPIRARDSINPFGQIYECKDGEWILLAVPYGKKFREFMHIMGLDEHVDDPRFSPIDTMRKNAYLLFDMFTEAFKTKPSDEWVAALAELDAPYHLVEHSSDIPKSEQAWVNNYITRVQCPDGREYVLPNSPVTFFGVERTQTVHAGPLGCNTAEVLSEHGYSDEEIRDFMERGIALES